MKDFHVRSKWYLSDWTDWVSPKVLSSTFFIFFTSVAPAITFSLYLSENTDDQLGAIEVLLSTAITGILFSIFAGQPLVIVGVTGPVSILTASIYSLSETWDINFIPFYAWSQIWAAIMLILLALFNACDALKYVTRFSCEAFGMLIAFIYIATGLQGIIETLTDLSISFGLAQIQFIIAVGTFAFAQFLAHARTWKVGNETFRELLSDYGATFSIICFSCVPLMVKDRLPDNEGVPTLFVPYTFETTSGRGWMVDLGDIPVWGVFAAIFPGLIIVVLFIFDHNVSSLLAQVSEMKLQKGTAFHLDFFMLGVGVLLTGLLGIPPTNGLIPQAPLHTKSLMQKRRVHAEDGTPTDKFEVEKVYEQRMSNFAQSSMTLAACFYPFANVVRSIPDAVLYGLFLFLGVSSFEDNEFFYRMFLMVMDSDLRKCIDHPYAYCKTMNFSTIQKYTSLQLACVFIIFIITYTPAGVIFPVLIAALIVLREYILPKFFSESDLSQLDSHILADLQDTVAAHSAVETDDKDTIEDKEEGKDCDLKEVALVDVSITA
jgi:hypothetical protein